MERTSSTLTFSSRDHTQHSDPDQMHRTLKIICIHQICLSYRRLSKRLVCQQLVRIPEKHNLLPICQSAYRRYHSTETAALKIVFDALSAADKGEVTLLGILDMSAAFDTVDHDILLHMSFGISAERFYLGSAPTSVKGRKPSLLTAKCPKRRWSPVMFPKAASSVQYCSCFRRWTWYASSRCMESTSTHMPTTRNYIFTPRRTKLH